MKFSDLESRLADLPVESRQRCLDLLDELTTPLTVREIERLVRDAGYSRTFSAAIASALKSFDIVVLKDRKGNHGR